MNDDVLDSYDLIDSYGMRPKKIVYHRLMVFKPHYQLLTTLGPNTIFLLPCQNQQLSIPMPIPQPSTNSADLFSPNGGRTFP